MANAEVMTDTGNWPVVQLPGRRFPGVVVQGDSLSIIVEELNFACAALRRGDPAEAEAELTEVLERLTGALGALRISRGSRWADRGHRGE
jgi:hypothetical protein